MNNDRELLEQAAKAAGIELEQIEIDGQIEGYDVNGEPIVIKGWNPLNDDGAAASKVTQQKASPSEAAKAARAASLTKQSTEGMPF